MLIPVEVVDLVPVHLPDTTPVCADCGRPTDRPRRLSGVGRPLCTVCWQRARRSREPDAAFGVSISQRLHRELASLGLSPRTILLYARTIQRAERWFVDQGWHLATARSHQVVAYLDTRPSSWACRNLMRAAFKTYWELVGHPKPPLRAMRVPPKPEMVCRALEEDDARILAKAARARRDAHGLAVIFGLYQGMRREEIAATRWDAIKDEAWLTIIGKGTKTRTIPLHPVTVEALSHVPATSEWVFPGRFGGHCSPTTIWQWIREVADESGVTPVRPHELRHTCLATQNDRTGDLRAVQAFAGHSKPETTSGYTRAKKAALRKVVDSIDY